MAHRDWGSKTGGGGVASEDHEKLARRERLRQLTLETIDLKKDPYFMRNHLGKYECKLCLTLHSNEGNYLAHTQGRRHQNNLRRRAALETRSGGNSSTAGPRPGISRTTRIPIVKIGRPGYEITKQRDPVTRQLSLLFQIRYPEIKDGFQPRHRFMSVYEQKVQKPDPKYQYILFAATPYETVGFRIPNKKIDRNEGRFYTNWDPDRRKFTLQLYFERAPDANDGENTLPNGTITTGNGNLRNGMADPFAGTTSL